MDETGGDGRFNGGIEVIAISCCKNFQTFEVLDAKIASALNKIIQNSHFKKKVSLEEQNAQQRTGFHEEDRSLSRSMTAFVLLVLMMQFLITLIYSLSLFVKTMFRNSVQDWTNSILYDKDSIV